MFWIWGVSLILIWTSNGNTTPLQCYACSKCDDCSNAPLTTCFSDQDVCAIVGTWDGDPLSPLKIAKQCDSTSHCPSDAIDANETHCDVSPDGVRCMTCCTGSGCNDGAVGYFPNPPPMPPIQTYKFDGCGSSTNCEVSATVDNETINVQKYCDKPLSNEYIEPEKDIDRCNIQKESGMCVTCCHANCFQTTSNNSQRTSYNLLLIAILGFISFLKILR